MTSRIQVAVLLSLAFLLSACPPDECGGIAPSVRNVSVSPQSLTLEVGDKTTVSATVGGECVGNKTGVEFSSSNAAVASVSSTGDVVGVAAGSTNIVAKSTAFGVLGSIPVTVRPPSVQSIALSPDAIQLRERKTAVLRATVQTTGGLSRGVQFTSAAPSIASVTRIDSLSVTVTGVAVGVTNIEVTSQGDPSKRVTARVTVDSALVATVAITGLPPSNSLLLTKTQQLGATMQDSGGVALGSRPVTWTSQSPAVLSVSNTGELRALSVGTSAVTATVPVGIGTGTVSSTANITVFGSLQIVVTTKTVTVDEGQTVGLSATVTATSGLDTSLLWESRDPRVASVSSSGVVSAVSSGSVVVLARSVALPTVYDSSRVTVQVRAVPMRLDVQPSVDTLFPAGTRRLRVEVRDQRGNLMPAEPVKWRSLTPSVATVDSSGTVTAIAIGSALVVAASRSSVPSDSLRDTTSFLIVDPCTFFRPISFGATYNGSFDASTCRGFIGLAKADLFSLTSSTQRSYLIRLTSTFKTRLVQLAVGNGYYGLPEADTTVAIGVMRSGKFTFFVASDRSSAIGTYAFTVTDNPDPALYCVTTDATRGVSFDTALIPGCQSRVIRILPAIDPGTTVNISASAINFPVTLELRNFHTDALLSTQTAPSAQGNAAVSFRNTDIIEKFVYLKVIGTNGNVRVSINQ